MTTLASKARSYAGARRALAHRLRAPVRGERRGPLARRVARGPSPRCASWRCSCASCSRGRARWRSTAGPTATSTRGTPRTRTRHVPAGIVSPRAALTLALGAGAGFLAAAATLGFWPAVLAPGVLAILLGYSYAKRFTWAAHLWLGVALALAPPAGGVARGRRVPQRGHPVAHGRRDDVALRLRRHHLYSLQDERFDRAHGLSSVPARASA